MRGIPLVETFIPQRNPSYVFSNSVAPAPNDSFAAGIQLSLLNSPCNTGPRLNHKVRGVAGSGSVDKRRQPRRPASLVPLQPARSGIRPFQDAAAAGQPADSQSIANRSGVSHAWGTKHRADAHCNLQKSAVPRQGLVLPVNGGSDSNPAIPQAVLARQRQGRWGVCPPSIRVAGLYNPDAIRGRKR